MFKIKNYIFVLLRNYIKGIFLLWIVEILLGMYILLYNYLYFYNDFNFNEELEDNFILICNVYVL